MTDDIVVKDGVECRNILSNIGNGLYAKKIVRGINENSHFSL